MRKAKSIFQGKNEPVWVRPMLERLDRFHRRQLRNLAHRGPLP